MSKIQNFAEITPNLPYILLSTFCGYGEASLQRVRDGRDNKSKEPGTILIKDKFVYRPFCKGKEPMDTIIALKDSSAVTRQNPRLYITCDGTSIVAYDPKDDDLKLLDSAKHAFGFRKGRTKIMIGASSEDIRLKKRIRL